jgi:XTP/dITP diphosphohydrolase
VYSARWLGEDTPYTEKNRKILDMLVNVPDEKRTARFVCVIAASLPDKRILTKEAAVEGRIAHEAKGENGFGYDPIFYLPEYGRTSAELRPEEKNRISHRGRALRAMLAMLKNI